MASKNPSLVPIGPNIFFAITHPEQGVAIFIAINQPAAS
jgi:hypothetical protein